MPHLPVTARHAPVAELLEGDETLPPRPEPAPARRPAAVLDAGLAAARLPFHAPSMRVHAGK